jgi:CubicO group peptidase (beta-lactamase class C family)
MSLTFLRIVSLAVVWWGCSAAALAGTPATASERWVADTVLQAGYPGARLLLATGEGEPVVDIAAGHADIARSRPLGRDAIYRIYSMTKPVVSAAALRLVGQGHARLDDPVALHLPALAGLQVLEDGRLREPRRAMTLRHLLTHTAGFAVEGEALRQREAADLERSASLADLVERLRGVPLERDPGTRFVYDGLATDVLGRLVEVWSGQALDAYLQAEFFAPLGMRDTGFEVPASHRDRVVELSRIDAQGRLVPGDAQPGSVAGAPLRPYPSAAGGLYSTATDYLAFARMLLARGRHDGRQLVPAGLVDAMFQDQLGPMGLDHPYADERPGRGFGLGLSVLLDPAANGRSGAPGQAGWSGAASTYFVIDPARASIGLLMLQHLPGDHAGELPRLALSFYNHLQQVPVP